MDDIRIIAYRIIFCVLGWTSIIISLTMSYEYVIAGTSALDVYGNMFSYYTIQTNVIVATWFLLAILYAKKEEKPAFMGPIVRGAITLYITVTFLGFAVLLSFLYKPTGIAAFTNLVSHYIVPIAVIIDWLVTGHDDEYEWKHIVYYLIYPSGYLIYCLIRGAFTGFYPYYFINPDMLGIPFLIIAIIVLVLVYVALGSMYIAINRKLYNKRNT